jgi:hypothetical protein
MSDVTITLRFLAGFAQHAPEMAAKVSLTETQSGDLPVQPVFQKYFRFFLTQIIGLSPPSHPPQGAYRDRHGRWDGMRWTRQRRRAR